MSDRLKIQKWVLSRHALERVIERKISIEELDLLIMSPDSIIEQGFKFILIKSFKDRSDNKIAAVIIEKKEELWLVVTVMVNFQKK